MIAYFIGGPQDMLKMAVRDNMWTLSFPHTPIIPLPAGVPPEYFDKPIPVNHAIYRKVYECHDVHPFSIYVYFETC